MADQNINPEDLNVPGPFSSGTTDIDSFLPFNGQTPSYKEVVPPSPVEQAMPSVRMTNNMYAIKDSITGLPPYTDPVPKVGKMTAQQKANAIFDYTTNSLSAYEDNDTYAKTYSYDPSSNGAHRAKYLAYGQKTFDKVGFNPLINNEALFNANTSIMDDFTRTFTTTFFPLAFRGAIANPKSYAGLFTGDFGQDVGEAAAYEELNAIGYSSKGGLGGFLNNTLNSFAYTAGILVEAAAEEALIGAALGSRGGVQGALAGATAGVGAGILRGLSSVPKALYSMTKNGAKMMTNLKNLDNINEARSAFNTSAKVVFDFANPAENIRNLYKGDVLNNANNLGNLARAKNTFAGFYLDVRNMNMALSESRLEGGFVENNTYKQLYDDHYIKFGVAPDTEKQKEFRQTAKQAGADALLYNSFLIFYSNKLVVPTLMKGSLLRKMANYSEDIINVGKKSKVILGKAGFEAVDVDLKTSLKALKNPGIYGRSAAAYFKANITEGLQENFQNVIADYTQKRYTEAYYEPAKMNFDFKKGMLKDALLKQISPEGFESFASGFVMGGYSKVLTGGYNYLTENYNKFIKDPKGYEKTITERSETAKDIAARLNKVYKNPKDFFNSRYFNYGQQVLISKVQDDETSTQKEVMDATDDSFITNLSTILKTGTMHHFIDNFQKLKQFTPEEVERELSLAPGEGEKALLRIDSIIQRARRMEKRYDASLKMQSGIDLNDYKEGSDEYIKASLLDEAYNVARANLVFMEESFDRNLERIQSISNEVLNLVNKSDKILASDVMAMISADRLNNELNMLQTEIETLKGVSDPAAVEKLKYITEKNNKLKNLKESLSALDPAEFAVTVSNSILENLSETSTEEDVKKAIEESFATKAAEMADEIVQDVKANVVEYLKAITGGTTEYNILMSKLSSEEGIKSIDSLVSSIIDVQKLDVESAALASAMNALTNPEEFLEHVNRNFKWMSDMYKNRSEYFKDVVNTSIEQKEYNDLLQNLSNKGIYVDLDEFAAWIENKNNLPTQFEDAINQRIITSDTPLYKEYIKMFLELANIQQEKPAGEKSNADELLKQRLEEEDSNLQKELDEARKVYDQELKKEIGYTEQELEELSQEQTDTTEQEAKLVQISEAIDNIEALALLEQEDLLSQKELIDKAALDFDITAEELEVSVLDITQTKAKRNAARRTSKTDSNYDLLNTPEGIDFLVKRVAVPNILKERASLLQKEIEDAKSKQVDLPVQVADTEAKKTYDAKVQEINIKYEKIKNDLVSEYGKQGASATTVEAAKGYKKLTIDTPWDELPADLKADLQKEFDKYRKENFKSEKDPVRLEILRQNWLKTQSQAIETYNTSIIGQQETEDVISADTPVLTFKAVTPEELRTKNLAGLGALISDMQDMLADKKVYDPKKKSLRTLTKKELDKLSSEIKSLQGYLSYRRSVAEVSTPEQEVVTVIENLIKDSTDNVEVIRDEKGRTIGRRIKGLEYAEGEYAARVTSEKERIVRIISPDYTPYVYEALKDSVITDPQTGQIVKKASKIESMFNRVQILTAEDTDEVKVDTFIEELKSAYAKGSIKKFGVTWKYNKIKEYFFGKEPKQFNLENIKEIINELANKESSETGTEIDSLSRDYLAGKKISRPAGMSERAFKNLKQILDKILDQAKDGKVSIVPKDVLLYDASYVSEDGKKGLVGEIDLLLIDENKNFYIVDFKTGHSGVWGSFNKVPITIDLTEAYSWKLGEAPKLTDNSVINWEDLGYESFDDFNSSYNNDISSISVLSTEGSNTKGDINGTIKIYFKKGSGKQAVNLEVKFTKPTYINTPEFSRRPEYTTQLTFYRNLFYNMTGILPKEIRILPLQTKINEEAQIESLELPAIADPKTGFITIEPVEEVNTVLPLSAEATSMEPVELSYEEYVPTSYNIKDNVGQTVLYQGFVGNIVEFEHETGIYAIETDEALYPIDTRSETNILNLGINTIKLNPQLFNQPVINGTVYNLNKLSDTSYEINGVEYTIERFPRKKGVKSLRYRSNDQAILNTQKEISEIESNYQDLLTKQNALTDDEKIIQGIQIVQQLAGIELKLEYLKKKLNNLVETNTEVISKNKDLINAIQSLPESFENSNTSQEEEEDLNDIKNKSENSAAIEAMYEIMSENLPSNFDKLITDINSVTKEDLSNFENYINSIIPKLEQLKAEYEGQDRLTGNITNEIAVLNDLLNFINNLNLNKDGRVSKTQRSKVKQQQKDLQQDVNEPAVQKSKPGKSKQVLGQQTQQGTGAQKVNSDLLQPMIYSLISQPTIESEEGVEDSVDLSTIVDAFEGATAETLDDVYFDILEKIRKEEINLPNSNYIDKLYKEKQKELATVVSTKTVNVDDILIRKNDSAIFRVTDKVKEGVDVINDSTGESMFISNKDLNNKYLKHYMQPTKEEPSTETFDDSDDSASEGTVNSIESAVNDEDAVQTKLEEFKELSKEERRNRLRDNSKCD